MFAMSRPEVDSDPYTAPPYVDFLLVMIEFCPRLLYVDRVGENSGVLPFLLKQLPPDVISKAKRREVKGWESMLAYREHTLPQPNKVQPARSNRKRPQKGELGDIHGRTLRLSDVDNYYEHCYKYIVNSYAKNISLVPSVQH